MNPPLSRELLERLATHTSERPVLSVYLPATLEVDERQQNDIRLKNLLREGQEKLAALGVPAANARQLVQAVQEASPGREIWKDHGPGFALFAGADFLRHVSLPYPVPEMAVAASRFYLKPLFNALEQNSRFYLLALSQNDVSLYCGDGVTLSRVELGEEVPRSLTHVTGTEAAGKEIHYHSADRGGDVAVYHGLGAGKDDTDAEIELFVRSVSEALEPRWKEEELPLILAGVESLLAVYRRVSDYAYLVRGELPGNVEHLSESDLHAKAWPFVREQLEERKTKELERLVHSDAEVPVSRELGDVVQAASDGRIDTLFVAVDAECWGHYDENERIIVTRADQEHGDVDLLDQAAVDAWLRGGRVYAIPASAIPGEGVAIAGLRY